MAIDSRLRPSSSATIFASNPVRAMCADLRHEFRHPRLEQLPLDELLIVVGAAPHRPLAPGGREPITEISRMRCADWRELNMGSGHVQVCE